jgi:hypothetical protein
MESKTVRFKQLEIALKGANRPFDYSMSKRRKTTDKESALALKNIFMGHVDEVDISEAIALLDEIINKE